MKKLCSILAFLAVCSNVKAQVHHVDLKEALNMSDEEVMLFKDSLAFFDSRIRLAVADSAKSVELRHADAIALFKSRKAFIRRALTSEQQEALFSLVTAKSKSSAGGRAVPAERTRLKTVNHQGQ